MLKIIVHLIITHITLQKGTDSGSSASINDERSDLINICGKISSHKHSSEVINNTQADYEISFSQYIIGRGCHI